MDITPPAQEDEPTIVKSHYPKMAEDNTDAEEGKILPTDPKWVNVSLEDFPAPPAGDNRSDDPEGDEEDGENGLCEIPLKKRTAADEATDWAFVHENDHSRKRRRKVPDSDPPSDEADAEAPTNDDLYGTRPSSRESDTTPEESDVDTSSVYTRLRYRTLGDNAEYMPRIAINVNPNLKPSVSSHLSKAIEADCRHIETSVFYHQDEAIRNAIKESGDHRESFFLTTKFHMSDTHTYPAGADTSNVCAAPDWVPNSNDQSTWTKMRRTVRRLDPQTQSLNLALIAGPGKGGDRLWRVLEGARMSGYVKEIGVCHYGIRQIEDMRAYGDILPAVNQLELHPWCQQFEIISYCFAMDITIQAINPFANHKNMDDPILTDLSTHYAKSKEAILIRWSLQRNFCPVLKGNEYDFDVCEEALSFQMTAEDMTKLNSLDEGRQGAQIRAARNDA